MAEQRIAGEVSFINHEKQYILIEYAVGDKKKNVKGSITEELQNKWKAEKKIKKVHNYCVGDVVHFRLKLTGQGDRMMATEIEFKYNNALDALIHKSKLDNRFGGYLKKVDSHYFVKELDSYLFFPVQVSPWQKLPGEEDLNIQVQFSIENTDTRDRVRARLIDFPFIPEYRTAEKYYRSKKVIEGKVHRITAHSVYVEVVSPKVVGKIATEKLVTKDIQIGDTIPVLISYLSPEKISIIPVLEQSQKPTD